MIELSDKDLRAIADSRAWEGKHFKLAFHITSWILVAILLAFVGYAAYSGLNNLDVQIPILLQIIGIVYIIGYFLFIFIGSYVLSKRILKQLKKSGIRNVKIIG